MKFLGLLLAITILSTSVELEERENLKTPYIVYLENERDLARLEKTSTQSGAYIEDEAIYKDISQFEKATKTENEVYILYIRKGENFPRKRLVEILAKEKTPMLILEKGIGGSQVQKVAEICGDLNVNIFIQIDSDNKYIYECFAEIFRKQCPRAVLVWSVPSFKKVDPPNKDLYDLVGINAFSERENGEIVSMYEDCELICKRFKESSIMLNVAVANYSIDTCQYNYDLVKMEMEKLYSLPLEYNNIGFVNYISMVKKYENSIVSNYRVTESQDVMNLFSSLVYKMKVDRYFIKSSYVCFVENKKAFMDKNFATLLGIKGEKRENNTVEIRPCGFNKSERKMFVKKERM